jgi:hypothetical protein
MAAVLELVADDRPEVPRAQVDDAPGLGHRQRFSNAMARTPWRTPNSTRRRRTAGGVAKHSTSGRSAASIAPGSVYVRVTPSARASAATRSCSRSHTPASSKRSGFASKPGA